MIKAKNNDTIQKQTFIDKCYKDPRGKVTLAQKPNLPILLWIICKVLLAFIKDDTSKLYSFLDIVAFGVLFTWSWLEIFEGTNYARRLLGLVVLCLLIIGRI